MNSARGSLLLRRRGSSALRRCSSIDESRAGACLAFPKGSDLIGIGYWRCSGYPIAAVKSANGGYRV